MTFCSDSTRPETLRATTFVGDTSVSNQKTTTLARLVRLAELSPVVSTLDCGPDAATLDGVDKGLGWLPPVTTDDFGAGAP